MSHNAKTIHIDKLRNLFSIDGAGVLRWKRTSRNKVVQAGDVAGRKHNKGYVIVFIERRQYPVSRIVYQLHNGIEELASHVLVDHADGDRGNNHPDNLRVCTHGQNMQNKAAHKSNKLQEKCICKRRDGKFSVTVKGNGVKVYRTFQELEAAKEFRDKTLLLVHGEFAKI